MLYLRYRGLTQIGLNIDLNIQTFCVIAARLVDGPSTREGRLEVPYSFDYERDFLDWGTVCDDGFTDAAARVVCYNLGYG